MKSHLFRVSKSWLKGFAVCLILFIPVINAEEINFDKLFNNKERTSQEQSIERKNTSKEVLDKAMQGTNSQSTPSTGIGGLAKEMFTCDDCSSSAYVLVDFESVCGIFGCWDKNLSITGGPGEYSPNYGGAPSGTIQSGMIYKGNNGIAGHYSWSAQVDNMYCSGKFYLSGEKRNYSIRVYKNCSDAGSHEF